MRNTQRADAAPAQDLFRINVALANDGEPRDIYVFDGQRDFLITRGKEVTVPRSVLEVLDHAVMGVAEPNPEDPNGQPVIQERRRFSYTLIGQAA